MAVQGLSIFHQSLVKEKDVKEILTDLRSLELNWRCRDTLRRHIINHPTAPFSRPRLPGSGTEKHGFGLVAARICYSAETLKGAPTLDISNPLTEDPVKDAPLKTIGEQAEKTSSVTTLLTKRSFQSFLVSTLDQSGLVTDVRNHTYEKLSAAAQDQAKLRGVFNPEYPLPPFEGKPGAGSCPHPNSLAVVEAMFTQWSELLLRETQALARDQVPHHSNFFY